jgi:hypothetical protein
MSSSEIESGQQHIVCDLKLLTAQEGGRETNTPRDKLHCMFEFGGSLYDCRLLLSSVGSVPPGLQFQAPIIFVNPDAILPRLHAGAKFLLRDPRIIAHGTVLSVHRTPSPAP